MLVFNEFILFETMEGAFSLSLYSKPIHYLDGLAQKHSYFNCSHLIHPKVEPVIKRGTD